MFPREIGTSRKIMAFGRRIQVPFGAYREVIGTNPNRTSLILSCDSNNLFYWRFGGATDDQPYIACRGPCPPLQLTLEDHGNLVTRSLMVFVSVADAEVGVIESMYTDEVES